MSDFIVSACAVLLAAVVLGLAAGIFVGIAGMFVYWGGSLLGFWP